MAHALSQLHALTWINGRWVEGNPPLLGPLTHGVWMSSVVFDGARVFEGAAPDLDMHCQRIIRSAQAMTLKPPVTAGEIEEIAHEGMARFPKDVALYVRPMLYAERGFVSPDPDSTRFVLSLINAPMPEPQGKSVTLSPYRRPSRDMAVTDAKAGCLYPNSARALQEAASRGFDNAVMLDPNGNVAELCTANVWMVKDDVAHTPAANGTFLAGVTRHRVIDLLRKNGTDVVERTLDYSDLAKADELFSTGNYGKVMPITRIDDRHLQPGPVYSHARELYWEYAHEYAAL